MPLDVKPNQDFLKFLSHQDVKKVKDGKGDTIKKQTGFSNLEMLLDLERNYHGMFTKVMSNFDNAKAYRDCLDEKRKSYKDSLGRCS